MTILLFLIPISLVVALCFLGFLLVSIKKGQFDDDYTPSVRILFDDEKMTKTNKK
ncbi:MAG TPA: cbb3-type cytochrome oxidase assembly protein CcoS [Cytophagaceae bacterium]